MFKLRPVEETDHPFIFNSWLKVAWNSHPNGKCPSCEWRREGTIRSASHTMGKSIFDRFHRRLIGKVVARGTTMVAVNEDDPDHLLGYAVFEHIPDPVLHFIYVKGMFRHRGVGKSLLTSAGISEDNQAWITQRTSWSDGRLKKYCLAFNPYLLWSNS